MITILNGKLTIPESERFIGFAGDNLARSIKFLVADEVSADSIYRLYLTFDDGTVNYFVLPSDITSEGVVLNWNVLIEHIFKSGLVKAQIKAFLGNDVVYHTNADTFIVGDSPEFADYLREQSTEFLEYEKSLNEVYKSIRDGIVSAEMIADGAITAKKIADGAVDYNHITDGAISPKKLMYNYLFLDTSYPIKTSISSEEALAFMLYTRAQSVTIDYGYCIFLFTYRGSDNMTAGRYKGFLLNTTTAWLQNMTTGVCYKATFSNNSTITIEAMEHKLVSDEGDCFESSTIEGALQEVGNDIKNINDILSNLDDYEDVVFAGTYSTVNSVMEFGTSCKEDVLYIFDVVDETNSMCGTGKCIGYMIKNQDENLWYFEFVNLTKGGVWRVDFLNINSGITQISNSFLTAEDVDSELSTTSENPVQNKAVKQAIKELNSKIFDINADMSYFSLSFSDFAELKAYEFVQGYRYFLDLEAISFDINGLNVYGLWEACLSDSNKLKLWNSNVIGYFILDLTAETLKEAITFVSLVDSELSAKSENPVQNKVVTEAITNINIDVETLDLNVDTLFTRINSIDSTLDGLENLLASI